MAAPRIITSDVPVALAELADSISPTDQRAARSADVHAELEGVRTDVADHETRLDTAEPVIADLAERVGRIDTAFQGNVTADTVAAALSALQASKPNPESDWTATLSATSEGTVKNAIVQNGAWIVGPDGAETPASIVAKIAQQPDAHLLTDEEHEDIDARDLRFVKKYRSGEANVVEGDARLFSDGSIWLLSAGGDSSKGKNIYGDNKGYQHWTPIDEQPLDNILPDCGRFCAPSDAQTVVIGAAGDYEHSFSVETGATVIPGDKWERFGSNFGGNGPAVSPVLEAWAGLSGYTDGVIRGLPEFYIYQVDSGSVTSNKKIVNGENYYTCIRPAVNLRYVESGERGGFAHGCWINVENVGDVVSSDDALVDGVSEPGLYVLPAGIHYITGHEDPTNGVSFNQPPILAKQNISFQVWLPFLGRRKAAIVRPWFTPFGRSSMHFSLEAEPNPVDLSGADLTDDAAFAAAMAGDTGALASLDVGYERRFTNGDWGSGAPTSQPTSGIARVENSPSGKVWDRRRFS